jgi:starvation-inducible DNA-binding protein
MEELTAALHIALANTFVMYFKAHTYHWNVEGSDFTQYHGFLDDLYNELHDAVDPLSERIRVIGQYSPHSLKDLLESSTIEEDTDKPFSPRGMFTNLLEANDKVIDSLNKVFELANKNNKQGIANFVADRLDVHAKHGWFLKSLLKG